jgi:RNA polymerase sigma-70 factor (ECF subfamily)
VSDQSDSATGIDTKEFFHKRRAEGWDDFVEHYGRKIRRWCRRCWHMGEEEADDLTQVVVVKLFVKMQTEDALWDPAKGRFHAWLKTVVRRAWLDAREERQRALGPGGNEVLELLANDAACQNFVKQLAQADLLQVAQERARARLTPKEWEVFRMRAFERHSAETVAGQVDLTTETVHNYTSRVRKILKEELTRLEEPDEE